MSQPRADPNPPICIAVPPYRKLIGLCEIRIARGGLHIDAAEERDALVALRGERAGYEREQGDDRGDGELHNFAY